MSVSLLLVSMAAANPASDGVLLNFTSRSCVPCQHMSPIVSRLQRQGYPIQKVDTGERKDLVERFNVSQIPTFVLVVGGREVARRVGAITEAELRRMLDQIPRRTQPVADSPTGSNLSAPDPRASNAPADGRTGDDLASRFEFPFPAGGGQRPRREQAPAPDAAREPPPFADLGGPPPAGGSPADWDQPVIRAQHDPAPRRAVSAAERPLASSTRIRVRDQGGTVYASATAIESRPGRTILLTCGHVFRNLPESAEIVADVFVDGRPEAYRGQVLRFDLQSDVGLLAIATSDPLPVSPVASADLALARGDAVFSIGCGGGEPPSRRDVRVTGLQPNTPPTYIECTGAPEQGRSGGGLFNARGELIGVCFAADAPQDRGLYANLDSIGRLLESCGLAHLYRRGRTAPSRAPESAVPAEFAQGGPGRGAAGERTGGNPAAESPAAMAGAAVVSAPDPDVREDQLAAAREALADPQNTEVVCIIRPRNQPAAASRVIVIHRASPKFVSFLTGELGRQPQETARRIAAGPPVPADDSVAANALRFATSEEPPFSHFEPPGARSSQSITSSARREARRGPLEHYRRSPGSRVPWTASTPGAIGG
jgi:S1-C subfamily serine protease/thiol-disulfide isomerase/thioredoxin